MLNIIDIQKIKKNNVLIVQVHVKIRNSAKIPVDTLDTDYVVKELCNEYKIKNIISEPNHKVGNTKKNGIKQVGVWNFELLEATEKQQQNKPATRKRNPRTSKRSTTSSSQKKSFRGRISDIAKNKEHD